MFRFVGHLSEVELLINIERFYGRDAFRLCLCLKKILWTMMNGWIVRQRCSRKASRIIRLSVKKTRSQVLRFFKNALTIYENDQVCAAFNIRKKNPICFPTSRWDTSPFILTIRIPLLILLLAKLSLNSNPINGSDTVGIVR